MRGYRYNLVLMDADDTIFDFRKAERHSFFHTMNGAGLPADDEAYHLYSAINEQHWVRLERGEIDRAQLGTLRFSALLGHYGWTGDVQAINAAFLRTLGESAFLVDHAEEACRELAAHCRIVLATNGFEETQTGRMRCSGIGQYIDLCITSEAAGVDKPDPRFFEYLFERCGHHSRDDVLMVGDRLTSDIKGGIDFGVDTCWFNPGGLSAPEGWPITHTIADLLALPAIVLGKT